MNRLLVVLLLCTVGFAVFSQTIDGVVEEGEYSNSAALGPGNFVFHWNVEGDRIHLAFAADTQGWVSVGFEPVQVMDQADMIFGWVNADGTAEAVDAFSTGTFGPHPPDTELGGTDDILEFAATEEGGRTTLEVTRLLVTGDDRDKEIPAGGTLNIIWAYGNSDDWRELHIQAGYGTVETGTGEVTGTGLPGLVFVHLVLMSISFLTMFAAMFLPRTMKREVKTWRPTHIAMELSGAILGIIGAGIGYYMVSITSGEHLRVLHSWFALVTIVLLVVTPIVGQLFLKLKKGKKQLRLAHHYTGRAALALMAWTIVLGLFQAGFF